MQRNTLKVFLFALLIILTKPFTFALAAKTISNSGEEIEFEFETSFRTLYTTDSISDFNNKTTQSQALWHADHIFGLFHSPEYAEAYNTPAELIEGFAGTKHPVILNSSSFRADGDNHIWVKYRTKGKALVLKSVVDGWLGPSTRTGKVSLPLIEDLPAIYKNQEAPLSLNVSDYTKRNWVKCTDPHYKSPLDFSYFYNPYRCPELSTAPIAKDVEFKIKRAPQTRWQNTLMPLTEIRSDNQNGELVVLYLINGFYNDFTSGDSPQAIHRDDGWRLYTNIGKKLVHDYGFTEVENLSHFRALLGENQKHMNLLTPVALANDTQRRYFATYVKQAGSKTYVVRKALFDTSNEERSNPLRSFLKFWKEAWENGDFIYYGGHSGSGASLDTSVILGNLAAIDIENVHFRQNKTQIAFFDSCSSYAYYQDMYMQKKPVGLHLLTYGMVSLFHLAQPSLETLIQFIMNEAPRTPTWVEALETIEQNQLLPALEFMYEPAEAQRLNLNYKRKGLYPSYLLNVAVPD